MVVVIRSLFVSLALALLMPGAHAAAPTAGASCLGLVRLAATTAPGFCVGLVTDSLKAPRGLAVLPDGDLIVADMGGWMHGQGQVWRLKRTGTTYTKVLLFDALDRPNGVALGPDGRVYVSMVGRVGRFAPGAQRPILEDIIGGASTVEMLPSTGRHPMPAILFDTRNDLIVSSGSASDHCENDQGAMRSGGGCPERSGLKARGVIRRYTMQWPAGKVLRWEVLARGVRNAMAMAVDGRTGMLWQGENSRDAMAAALPSLKNDEDAPHDELNLIVAGADYGWPYCYDMNVPSPEYPEAACRDRSAPFRLLPGHAAPLGMAFYTGKQFPPAFAHSLVIAYHGYRSHGHRVVALLDQQRSGPAGRSVTLIEGDRKHKDGLGAPVGIAIGADGAVYVSDDRGGTIARLSYEKKATVPR